MHRSSDSGQATGVPRSRRAKRASHQDNNAHGGDFVQPQSASSTEPARLTVVLPEGGQQGLEPGLAAPPRQVQPEHRDLPRTGRLLGVLALIGLGVLGAALILSESRPDVLWRVVRERWLDPKLPAVPPVTPTLFLRAPKPPAVPTTALPPPTPTQRAARPPRRPTPKQTPLPLPLEPPSTVPSSAEWGSPSLFGSCTHGKAEITSPAPGAVLSGVVTIIGTVTCVDGFRYYKFELEDPRCANGVCFLAGPPPQCNNTAVICPEHYGFVRPVINGVLMRWDTRTVPDGAYTLRLVAVGADGNELQPPARVLVVVHNASP